MRREILWLVYIPALALLKAAPIPPRMEAFHACPEAFAPVHAGIGCKMCPSAGPCIPHLPARKRVRDGCNDIFCAFRGVQHAPPGILRAVLESNSLQRVIQPELQRGRNVVVSEEPGEDMWSVPKTYEISPSEGGYALIRHKAKSQVSTAAPQTSTQLNPPITQQGQVDTDNHLSTFQKQNNYGNGKTVVSTTARRKLLFDASTPFELSAAQCLNPTHVNFMVATSATIVGEGSDISLQAFMCGARECYSVVAKTTGSATLLVGGATMHIGADGSCAEPPWQPVTAEISDEKEDIPLNHVPGYDQTSSTLTRLEGRLLRREQVVRLHTDHGIRVHRILSIETTSVRAMQLLSVAKTRAEILNVCQQFPETTSIRSHSRIPFHSSEGLQTWADSGISPHLPSLWVMDTQRLTSCQVEIGSWLLASIPLGKDGSRGIDTLFTATAERWCRETQPLVLVNPGLAWPQLQRRTLGRSFTRWSIVYVELTNSSV